MIKLSCIVVSAVSVSVSAVPAGSVLYVDDDGEPCVPQWDSAISQLGLLGDRVSALTVFNDGSGPALYAGGGFETAGGVPADSVARWNGSSWTALGTGLTNHVEALIVFDDGGGPALYSGGNFTNAGEANVNHIAKWDGSSWSSVRSGMNGRVIALAVFDDGSGPALYAGGFFTIAGGIPANHIAKWDGENWSALGTGMMGDSSNDRVQAPAVFDDGSGAGTALYAGGLFTHAGGVAATSFARWDGTSWSSVGELRLVQDTPPDGPSPKKRRSRDESGAFQSG